jgi:hypothetical protein
MVGTPKLVMTDVHPRGDICVRKNAYTRARSRSRLQKRAAHRKQLIFVRQTVRKPQPPIAQFIVDFS